MTHPPLDELLATRDGDAVPTTAAHVAGCARCQETLVELRALRARLAALPQAEPPAGGWERLQHTLANQRRARMLVRGGWAAAAAMVLFTVTVAVRGSMEAWTEARLQQQVKALVVESQRLEGQLRSSEIGGRVLSGRTAYAIADLQSRVEAIDARLAAARRERRPTTEIVDLWQQRVALLDDLASVQNTRVAYIGI